MTRTGGVGLELFSDHVVLSRSRIGPARITVDGSRIVAVQPVLRSALATPPQVDLGSRLIAPAFVNTHTHLVLSALRGLIGPAELKGNVVEEVYFRVERELTPTDVRAFARIGAYECLLSGTGAVWDHYYQAREIADVLMEMGLCGVLAPTLQDRGGPGAPWLEQHLAQTADIDEDSALREAGIVAAVGPHATDTVSDALWGQVIALADARSLPIHAHLAQSPEEVQRSLARHGCTPLSRLQRLGVLHAGTGALLVHGLYISDAELAALPTDRVTLGYCPAAQAIFDFPAPIAQWAAAGGRIVLGTDAGSCNDTMNVQSELRFLAAGAAFSITDSAPRQAFAAAPSAAHLAALTAHRQQHHDRQPTLADLLDTVWATPGRLHRRLAVGELRPGARANLLVLDLDHPALWPGRAPLRALVYGSCAGAIHGLMLSGQWIGQRGNFHRSLLDSDDYRSSVTEGYDRLSSILSRVGIQ